MKAMLNPLSLKDRYWGVWTIMVVGLLSFLGFLNVFIFFPIFNIHTDQFPDGSYGVLIVLGALIYMAAKKQKFRTSKVWLGVEVMGAILFLKSIIPYSLSGMFDYGNFWSFAFSRDIVAEYRIPAIVSVVVVTLVVISYCLVKFKKIS